MRQPCRHIAAVGHAFVLFDFMCGLLSEVGIGKVGKEVGKQIAVDRFVGVDVFGVHSADQMHGKSGSHPLDSGRNDHSIVADIAAARAGISIYRIRIVAVSIVFLATDAAGIFVLPELFFIVCDDLVVSSI